MNNIGSVVIAIVSGIIGLSALAIVLSSNSNTTNVTNSFFTGLTNIIGAALKPATQSGTL